MNEMPTGFPTAEDIDKARHMVASPGDWIEGGTEAENLAACIASVLASERRKAFNEGAVAGMRLSADR